MEEKHSALSGGMLALQTAAGTHDYILEQLACIVLLAGCRPSTPDGIDVMDGFLSALDERRSTPSGITSSGALGNCRQYVIDHLGRLCKLIMGAKRPAWWGGGGEGGRSGKISSTQRSRREKTEGKYGKINK